MIRKTIRSILRPFPFITLVLRSTRDLLGQRAPSKPTPWGFTIVGNDAMAAGTFEPEETKLVRELLKSADLLINVGANIGYYCCHALSLSKTVIAIEPNAQNLHYLLRNMRQHDWPEKVQVYPVALGRSTNILRMWGGGTGASLIEGWAAIPEDFVTQVPVLSLDRVLGDSIQGKRSLILVDIEGSELMMLHGAKQTLALNPKPIWMVEIASTEHQPAGIDLNPDFKCSFDIFFDAGYKAFTADDSQEEITPDLVQAIVRGDRQMKTHNFIFR